MSSYLVRLLGKHRTGRSVAELSSNLDAVPEVVDGEDGTLYHSFREKGIDVAFGEDDRLVSIFLYPGTADDRGYHGEYASYPGQLPGELNFEMCRSKVHEELGRPRHSGGGEPDPYLGPAPTWDTYVRPDFRLHIQYLKGGERISLIELSVPDGSAS